MRKRNGYILALVVGISISSIGVWSLVNTFTAPPIQHSGTIVARYQTGSDFHFIINESGSLQDVPVPSTIYFAGPSNGQPYEWTTRVGPNALASLSFAGVMVAFLIGAFTELFGEEDRKAERSPFRGA